MLETPWTIIGDSPLPVEPFSELPGDLSKPLSELAVSLPDSTPLLICGEWGSGKTSLLLRMKYRLDRRVPPPAREFDTVWFNAWDHEGEGSLLASLLREVWRASPHAFRNTERAEALYRTLWTIASVVNGRASTEYVSGAKQALARAVADRLVFDAITSDPVETLRSAFFDLIRNAWQGRGLILFVDDLDRCGPTTAVAFIDAMKTLFFQGNSRGCHVVVAVDKAVLVRAASVRFAHVDGYDGNRYLEKIFPVEVHVPALDEEGVRTTLADILELMPAADKTAYSPWFAHLRAAFKPGPFANPRLIKRTVNKLSLLLRMEGGHDCGDATNAATDRALVEWIVAAERWPVLRRLIASHDVEVWAGLILGAKGSTVRPGGMLDPDLDVFAGDRGVQLWLRGLRSQVGELEAKFTTFQRAERRLRRCGL